MTSSEREFDIRLKTDTLRQMLVKMQADGCLLSKSHHLLYVTGRIFNGYYYLPDVGEPLCFVRRPTGMAGEGVLYIRKPEDIPALMVGRCKAPRRLLLEADDLSFNEYMRLKGVFNPEWTGDASEFIESARAVKTPYEVDQFRRSAGRHRELYERIPECFRVGMTDLEFQYEIEYRMRKLGSLGVFRTKGDMDIFMGSILAGENAETPSPFDFALGGAGIPSLPVGANGTRLREGMSVMVDMVGNYTPYMTDMSRTFSIGKLPPAAEMMHQVSIDIMRTIEDMARPGVLCSALYRAAMDIVEKKSLGAYFMGTRQQARFIGHGTGIQINERPVISPRSKEALLPGMVIALEPKFVLPGIGPLGVEDSYAMHEGGLEKLTECESGIIDLLAYL